MEQIADALLIAIGLAALICTPALCGSPFQRSWTTRRIAGRR